MVELLHFRGSWEIIKGKNLDRDIMTTLEYLEECLYGALYRRELTTLALKETMWREDDLTIIEGRRYQYKGFKRDVALEGSFAAYEYILEGSFRLQLGFDKGRIETGVLMLTSQRSENSKLGTSAELAKSEIEQLYPTISMPLTIAVLDLGDPNMIEDEQNKNENKTEAFQNADTDMFTPVI
jgi:hypothetical protein